MTTTAPTHNPTVPRSAGLGIWVALLSAATFGSSGSFGKSLLEAGWTPGAVVTARVSGAALLMAIPSALALRGRWHLLRRHAVVLTLYGVVAIAVCQVFYFNAVTRMSVALALLLEYLAPVLLIGIIWLRSRARPSRLTLTGAGLSIAGLVLVLNLTGEVRIDLVGVAWGLAAALCLVVYFVISARPLEGLPAIVLASGGLTIAAGFLLVAGALGVMPMAATTTDVPFMGGEVSWAWPLLGMVVIATSVAYTVGIVSTRMLGSRLASFVGLTEVLFAVFFAWLMLDELPLPIQLLGGVLIVAGVSCVRYDELSAVSPERS